MSMRAAIQMVAEAIEKREPITVLTGAGISAESGIPTFRGPEGFWTIGSSAYTPQEMATLAMFDHAPAAVWAWYLYRLGICRQASPNEGHRVLAAMESRLSDRFTLITQNVDNLHIVAGNSLSRTLQIHGNIFYVRCRSGCTDSVFPLPEGLAPKEKGQALTMAQQARLKCPACGSWLRPHVLWFDETYNERHFRFDTAMRTAGRTRLLITVGTTGATTLPIHIVNLVLGNGGQLIDINIADNAFSDMARQSGRGIFINQSSSKALIALAEAVLPAAFDP